MHILYFLTLNILTFLIYGMDKYFSKRNMFRISEKILLFLSIIGGMVGAILGMNLFRHKTKKIKFKIINYLSLIIWLIVITKY